MKTTLAVLSAAVLTIGVSAAMAAPAYVDTVTAQNPLLYYRLNDTTGATASAASPTLVATVANLPSGTTESANIGANRTGVLVGQTSSTNGLLPPSFLGFESSNTWFTLGATTSADFVQKLTSPLASAGSTSGSIAVFFETTTGATAGGSTTYGRIYEGDAGSTGALYAFIDGTGKAGLRIANGTNDATQLADVRTTKAYNDGKWHLLDVTWDNAAGTVALYIDGGTAAGGETETGTYASGTMFTFIGRNQIGKGSNNASEYQGSVDEFALFGTALTAQQVANEYSAATTGVAVVPEPGVTAGLAGLLPLVMRRRR